MRNGFGVKPQTAVWTPIVALLMAGVGGVSLAAGDQRVGVFTEHVHGRNELLQSVFGFFKDGTAFKL